MTAKFKFLAALLVLLASWTGQVRAEQAPPPQSDRIAVAAVAVDATETTEAPDRLSWQRVGSPTTLEA